MLLESSMPSPSWRAAGRRRPTLYEAFAGGEGVSFTESTDSSVDTEACISDEHTTPDQSPSAEQDSSAEEFVMSPLEMGGLPAIPLSPLALEASSLDAESPAARKQKRAVAWATPKSLHDTRIITPATHPNRMGQFGKRERSTAIPQSLRYAPAFSGSVGSRAQVALIDGVEVASWMDCEITVCNNDGTYDIVVLPSPLADVHHVSNLAGHGIHPFHLRKCLKPHPLDKDSDDWHADDELCN